MRGLAALVFSLMLTMNTCPPDNSDWVVMRQPSNHNCAAMEATAMGSAAGMTEQLGRYSSKSQAVSALAGFKAQVDPNNAAMHVCE
jgi:hypothetical protein